MKLLNRLTVLNKLVLFCLALVIVRFFKTGHYSFLFLFWNLLLAWLPLFFIRKIKKSDTKPVYFLLLMLSIAFLPNAPYILTDLFHLKKALVAPLWLDLILILSFAFTGLFYFILAFDLILEEITLSCHKTLSRFAKPVLLLATGYGIYLGRYLRYNSWDIITRPIDIAGGMFNSVFDMDNCKQTLAVTLTFTVFLYLIFEIYLSFKNKLILKQNGLH